MNNTQLYLSIGIPTFAILLTWYSNQRATDKLEDRMNARFDRLETKVDTTATELRVEMNGLRREIHQDMIPLHERMAKLEGQR